MLGEARCAWRSTATHCPTAPACSRRRRPWAPARRPPARRGANVQSYARGHRLITAGEPAHNVVMRVGRPPGPDSARADSDGRRAASVTPTRPSGSTDELTPRSGLRDPLAECVALDQDGTTSAQNLVTVAARSPGPRVAAAKRVAPRGRLLLCAPTRAPLSSGVARSLRTIRASALSGRADARFPGRKRACGAAVRRVLGSWAAGPVRGACPRLFPAGRRVEVRGCRLAGPVLGIPLR